MTRAFDFRERLEFATVEHAGDDWEIIMRCHPGTVSVAPAPLDMDKRGVDYIATLETGVTVYWDVKRREKGCSRYWKMGAEVALEMWSDMANKRPGWTWDAGKITHYVLFAFDPADHDRAYAIPFQSLRAAFLKNGRRWLEQYEQPTQDNVRWLSQCLFVPVWELQQALYDGMAVPA